MCALNRILCRFTLFGLLFCPIGTSAAIAQQNNQAAKNTIASNLIRPEYYAGIDFIADGQTSQALAVLNVAFNQARSINDQRGIDSVPSLVMMGECHLTQCDIASALENYDAALQISLTGQRWISLLKNPPGNFRADPRTREITWVASKRGTQMGIYTEAWPIDLMATDVLLENTNAAASGKLLSIDALEILRCQAIALRRRYQLLGPLGRHIPLNESFLAAFNSNGHSELIACSLNICRALADLSNGGRDEPGRILKQNLSLANGLDHPLTAVALLALSDIAIDANEMNEAEERATEAALTAARAGQMDHLAEAIEYLSATGFAAGHDSAVAKLLPQIVGWSAKKSRLVTIRGQVEWTRLSALMGEVDGFRKNLSAVTTMLLPKPVVLPRAEAAVRYSRASIEFLEGKVSDGFNSLLESIAYLRSPSNGVGSPIQFQLNMAESLCESKALTDEQAERLLSQLVSPPAAGLCRARPLEQVSWLLADKTKAITQLNGIRLRTQSDAQMVAALDDAAVRRYRQKGESESRMFDLQMAIHADKDQLTPIQIAQAQVVRLQLPALQQNASKIAEQVQHFRANPKRDLRKWTEDDTRRWDNAVRLSDTQESLCFANAIGPLIVPEMFPPRHSEDLLKQSLQVGDVVIFFGFIDDKLRGYLHDQGKWTSWTIAQANLVQRQTNQLANDLLLLKSRDTSLNAVNKIWSLGKRMELRNTLFPREIWAKLAAAKRWIIVPDRFLWYVPYEALPANDRPSALPSILEHRIVYVPTLGLVPQMLSSTTRELKDCVNVYSGDFFSANSSRAKEIRDELTAIRNHIPLEIGAKGNVFPASRYFKTTSDQVCNYSISGLDSMAPVPTDRQPNQSSIHTWRRLPWGTPNSIILAGVNAMPIPNPATGDEWLRSLLPSIAQGTRHVTISRWAVGGESTASVFKSFVEYCQDMPASEAWQRSVVRLWEEEFDPRLEPVLRDVPATSAGNSVSGSHPLLWAGYINLGDTQ